MPAKDRLKSYRAKRDFRKTAEPSGDDGKRRESPGRRYLIQKHDATRLHFDFRLEIDGVLASWAVTRGPSLDPEDKRLAVHTEDHPLDYGEFEGTIPKGEYGGGTVMLWDEGIWEPIEGEDDDISDGKLKFTLYGQRLRGNWMLVRIKNNRDKKSKADNWLLFKERDDHAVTEKNPLTDRALTSVRTGRTMEEIAEGHVEWSKSGPKIRGESGDAPAKRAPRKSGATPKRLPLPKFVVPQLASLADDAPAGNKWLHEIKYDGYRAIAATAGGKVAIHTRTGLDWSDRFASLVQPLADLPCKAALIDGEICVLDDEGRSDFGALQDALGSGRGGLLYYAFDLLALDGKDLKKEPQKKRKEKLAKLLEDMPPAGPLIYSDHIEGQGPEFLERAKAMQLEGIVSKLASAPYRSGRSKNWVKSKTGHGQEFVIIGWDDSPVRARPFASLLMAARESDRLVFRGKVGSGFSDNDLEEIGKELKKRAVKEPTAEDIPPSQAKGAHFVRPELVAEIAFRGWTREGLIRQGSFKGLRKDKPAAEIIRELADPPNRSGGSGNPGKGGNPGKNVTTIHEIDDDKDGNAIEIAGVRITNPDRVMFPGRNITKHMLIDYQLAVAERVLPHVVLRPLSLVRCPRGQEGDCFFQKHASKGFPEEFKPIEIAEKESRGTYLYIEDERGLVAAVQMGALELHIWGSHNKTLEKPDRLVFDFDPDEEVDFAMVKLGATEMRQRLKSIGIESFCMTTGGKGLHVVVPLKPKHQWDDIKAFAEAMARMMAADDPDRYLAVMSKAKRKGRIFIDYLRNGRGATAIAPFSTRARAGAPVAWPVNWRNLSKLENAHPVTIDNYADVLKRERSDPWKGYFEIDQVLPLEKLRGG
jgi:bifunctional non-homologous end joining protein LigD